jgi:hypothetical protein
MGITIKSDGRTSGCTANLRDIEGNQWVGKWSICE